MKTSELIRSIAIPLFGALLMFWLQPMVYQNRLVRISDLSGKIEAWVSNYYMPSALLVFIASIIAILSWFLGNRFSKAHRSDEVDRWRVVWWGIGVIPVVAIIAAIFLFKRSDDVLPSLTAFFVLDVILLYWGTTVSSTPFPFTYLPPLSSKIRGVIGV